MGSLIDIYAHLGTTYSYATVASEVALALRAAELLGTVFNLDEAWHDEHVALRADGQGINSHALVFSAPNHYITPIIDAYGRDRTALFVSPNTDTLADEHTKTCEQFGKLIVPSSWCEDVVSGYVADAYVTKLPLGVDVAFSKITARLPPYDGQWPTVLHLTSDQAWPGRKGTEELLQAWAFMMQKLGVANHIGGMFQPRLLIHAPQSLQRDILLMAADLKIRDTVAVLGATKRGATTAQLVELYQKADLVCLPSRCEGFGMMILAALVAKRPLLTTYTTGQTDFLARCGGWLAIPTCTTNAIAYETGNAAVIEPVALAHLLKHALGKGVMSAMMEDTGLAGGDGTWPWAMEQWLAELRQWVEEN